MNLWQELRELWEVSLFEFNELWQTNWPAVQFKRPDFIYLAAAILGAAFLFKPFLLKLWNRFWNEKGRQGFYEHSGYIFDESSRLGWFTRFLSGLFKIILAAGAVVILTALADPYTTQTGTVELEEFREIVYLKDASTSMGWRFKNYEQSRAEIVQDFHLKLIARRRGKHDRAAFFLFETRARLMADFTKDTDSLLFSVDNAPLVISHSSAPDNWGGRFIIKKGFRPENNSGSTNLHLGLAAVLKLFELKGDKNIKERSVIIITDGAAELDPEPQLRELKKMNIIPYLVFIDPDTELEARYWESNPNKLKLPAKLLNDVRKYGGASFVVIDKNSLEKISQKLDQLHTAKFMVKKYSKENFIYRRFLTAAIWLVFLAGAVRLLTWAYQKVT